MSERGCEQQEKPSQSKEQHNVLIGLQKQLSCRPSMSTWVTAAPQTHRSSHVTAWTSEAPQKHPTVAPKSSASADLKRNHPAKRRLRKQNWQRLKQKPEIDVTEFVWFLKCQKCWDKFTLKCCPRSAIAFYRIYHCLWWRRYLFFSCVCVFSWDYFFQQNWEEERWREGYWTHLSMNRGRGERGILKASVFVWSPEWLYSKCCLRCVHLSDFFSAHQPAASK